MADLKSIFGDDAEKSGKKPSLFSEEKKAAPKIFSEDDKPKTPSIFTDADKPAAPKVFSDGDRPKAPEIFKDGEKGRFCRYCKHYVVNPFTQRCDLHRCEVEATDTCPQFEKADPEQ